MGCILYCGVDLVECEFDCGVLYLVFFGFCLNAVKDKVKQVGRAQINQFVNDNSEKCWEISHNMF